ncbi:MAG: hypothetical protein NTU64_11055 [Hyphomicrobiales bacterium]|nr:hypothetical protein [Hyphomicrobiales bacterium]
MAPNYSWITSLAALGISALALVITSITAWLTLFKRGTVNMTQPTVVFFGPDGQDSKQLKVFLRTLLFSTAKRGRIVESMYVSLQCEDIYQIFDVWAYGEKNDLVRGSGLFVSETGVEANHHFLASRNNEPVVFIPGMHQLSVYVNLLGEKKQKLLFSVALSVSQEEADEIGLHGTGLYFDWAPEDRDYVSHIHRGPRSFWESTKSS